VATQQVNGERKRVRVDGPTKSVAQARLKVALDELHSGVVATKDYTVARCVEDFLDHGLNGRSAATRASYEATVKSLLTHVGRVPLAKLTTADVRRAVAIIAEDRSDRTVRLAHDILTRAIDQAVADNRVSKNVSALLTNRPQGQARGRESRAMTMDVAMQLMRRCMAELRGEAKVPTGTNMAVAAYTVLSWSTGLRTEEARALEWSEVDLADATVSVIQSVRGKGRTKTVGSRRTLQLPDVAVAALQLWQQQQRATDGHVFTTHLGHMVDSHHMGRMFTELCERAGIGSKWVPRELRHSFVSAMSASGVPIERIGYLAGHSGTSVTESVYRQTIVPALREGAMVMNELTQGL
jgi:integrase